MFLITYQSIGNEVELSLLQAPALVVHELPTGGNDEEDSDAWLNDLLGAATYPVNAQVRTSRCVI